MEKQKTVVCVGAGPAGLTAAQLLAEKGIPTLVLEANPKDVGGISRTEKRDGFLIDIGGHRFFSKSKKVNDFWKQTLGSDFLYRSRSSKIFYKGKFYHYPLRPLEALSQLGIVESIICLLSLAWWKCFPVKDPKSFADWTKNQFGNRFFQIFFKTYTEKVWGLNCAQISADWAAQRIQGVSPFRALFSKLFLKFVDSKKAEKSLIEGFHYPKLGPGMMWEKVANNFMNLGGELLLESKVNRIELLRGPQGPTYFVHFTGQNQQQRSVRCDHVISSMPMKQLLRCLEVPQELMEMGDQLQYRDFLIVALVLKDKEIFKDNWIYIHDPAVKVGRIQNFRAASPHMVPSPEYYCYGMEYFCNDDSDLWLMSDKKIIALAISEMKTLGFDVEDLVGKSWVIRQKKAYPVYDHAYKKHVETISNYLAKNFENLHLVGRNGMHKYNNQDHSMMTAMLTVENILAGKNVFNVWQVNQDAEYLEIDQTNCNEREFGLMPVPELLKSK